MKKFTLGIYLALVLIGLMGLAFWYLASIHVLQYVVYGTLALLAIVVLLLLWWLVSRIGESGARREVHRKQMLAEVARQEREDKLADVEAEARRITAEAQRMRAQAELTARNADYLAARAQAQDLSNRSALYLHERQTALGRGLHYPTEQGHQPLHWQITEQGVPLVTYPHQGQRQLTAARITEPEIETPVVIPARIFTFQELLASGQVEAAIAQGKMLLGYVNGQLRFGSWLDLYSCGVGGVSGSGKTTTVRFLLFQAILAGAKLLMIDPHIHEPEESLAAQFAIFEGIHKMPPCDETAAQVARRVRWLSKECAYRIQKGIKGPPLVLVLDEFNAIVRRAPDELRHELADLLETIAQEGRKFGIFAMIIAQRWSEQDLGGKNHGAAIRSSLAAMLAHRFTDQDQAKKMIGPRGAKTLDLEQGHHFFRDTGGGLVEMTTPYTTSEDGEEIARLLSGARNQYENGAKTGRNQSENSGFPSIAETPRNLLENRSENSHTGPLDGVQDDKLAKSMRVLKMLSEGSQKPEIIKALWGVSPGASQAYVQANAEYQEVMKLAYERLGE